ncbi:kinase-like domain-containing protein [Amanita rubescens]|nr:kinase-like domain-containing protein [Amanita rubescens]
MLKHEFVLSFLGICEEQDETFLVSPYMGNGTLAQWRNRAKPLIAEIWKRILEVAQGMRYIHSEGIVHGDLRGANVLLDANLHVQIADFGLTRLMGMTDTETGAKHINFSAPELFGYVEDANAPLVNESTRTQMSDVYAFGCLYYEIHYDSIPFAGRHEGQIVNLVIQDKRPSRLYDPPLSDEAWGIIQRCWEREPWKRRGMQDVVESLISASQSRTTKSQNYEMLIKESLPAPSVTFRNAQAHRRDSNGSTLPLLLSMLKDKKPGSSIASVVNATTINLTWKLLSSEDYVSVTDDLNKASDVQNLLDFMLHLLRDHRLPHQDPTVIIDQRARRFMMKVISKVPVMPPSLIVTGVRIPANRSYLHGGFGSVFKGEFQGSTVALRVLHKTGNNIAFCREALMWHSLTHKFVLPLLGIYEGEDGRAPQAFLVSPYMENGTLAQWRRDSLPPIAEIEKRILQVAQGLEYIHSEGIVHGDIRGSNVLLDGNLHVQIADFGLTRVSEATTTGSGALHINFAAPELFGFSENDDSFEGAPARTQMSDIYAFGCLYYEIHYDTVPFVGKTDFQVLALASRGILPSRLEDQPLSDLAWDVIQRCWTREPSKRPRMKDVVESVMWLMLNR